MRLLISLALAYLAVVSAAGPLNTNRDDTLALNTYGTGLNLAIGGATSRYYNIFGNPFVNNGQPRFNPWLMTNEPQLSLDLGFPAVWGLPEQFAYIRERHTEVAFANDTLYVLWSGGNDVFVQYFFTPQISPYTGVVDTLISETRSLLSEFEARTILIPTLPDVINTPFGQGFFLNETIRNQLLANLIIENTRLRNEITILRTEFINSTILILENDIIFPTVLQTFAHNQTEACSTQVDSGKVFQNCTDPENWYFWDDVHPTAAVHQLIATTIAELLTNASIAIPSQWIVLGDSLSDPGQLRILTTYLQTQTTVVKHPLLPPVQHYPLGRFTNDRVWAEYLGERWNRPLIPFATRIIEHRARLPGKNIQNTPIEQRQTLAVQQYQTGINFAFGGAALVSSTRNVLIIRPEVAAVVPTLQNILDGIYPLWGIQDELEYAQKRFEHTRPADDSMFIIWAGGNDHTVIGDYRVILPTLLRYISIMIERWSPHTIVIGNFLDRFPPNSNTSEANTILKEYVIQLNRNHPRTKTILFDAHKIYQNVLTDAIFNNGAIYGITNITGSCSIPIVNTTSYTICSNPDTYFLWDHIHPTRPVHKLLATEFISTIVNASIPIPSQWFVFGDSLSDNGQLKYWGGLVGQPFPPTGGYPLNRYTNEYTWSEYVATNWSRPLSSASLHVLDTLRATKRYQYGINMAVGGARAVGNSDRVPTTPAFAANGFADGFWDLPKQVDHIKSLHATLPISKNAFHFIWIGGNDLVAWLRNATTGPSIPAIIASIRSTIETLITTVSARRILIGLLPDLSLTPEAKMLAAASAKPDKNAATILAEISVVTSTLNNLIRTTITNLNKQYGFTVAILDVPDILSRVLSNPLVYNLTNLIDPCYNNLLNTPVCLNPSNYLFYDVKHPTTAAHAILAKEAHTVVTKIWKFGVNETIQWFNYGDSLSDQGNNQLVAQAFGAVHPVGPYYNGAWSDGPVISTILSQLLNPSSPAKLTLSHTRIASRIWGGGLNFASGGATTGGVPEDNITDEKVRVLFRRRNATLPWGVQAQIQDATTRFAKTPAHPDALYVLWAGGNDYLSPNKNVTATVFALYARIIELRQSFGAHRFLIGLMPDLGSTPLLLNDPTKTASDRAEATLGMLGHNAGVMKLASGFLGSQLDVEFAFMNPFDEMKNAMQNPEAYGFKNVNQTCFDQEKGTVCDHAKTPYLFWDNVHPTALGHQVLANYTISVLEAAKMDWRNFPQYHTFGDSLSDPGNNYMMGLAFRPIVAYPPFPYDIGHYSNGPAYSEQLGFKLGLTQTPIAKYIVAEYLAINPIPTNAPTTIIPTQPPTFNPPTNGTNGTIPTSIPGQSLVYSFPIRVSRAIMERGDSITVASARLARALVSQIGQTITVNNIIIDITNPTTLEGKIYFRADNMADATTWSTLFADPTRRAGWISRDTSLSTLIVTSNTPTFESSTEIIPCGTGYKKSGSDICTSDTLPAPTRVEESSSPNVGLIVGLVVGLTGGLIALIIYWFALSWCLKKRDAAAGSGKSTSEAEMTAV